MNSRKMFLFAFLFNILFLLGNFSFADGTIYYSGEGNTVIPITSNQIEMVEEKVIIEPSHIAWLSRRFNVDCTFVFHNTGNDTEILMGFPDIVYRNPEYGITKFQCYINKKKIKTEYKKTKGNPLLKNIDYPAAYVWKVKFKKDETKIVKNTYECGGTDTSWVEINYILRTGALWKGNIGKAIIIVNNLSLPSNKISIHPKGYKIKKDKIIWKFKNFEPKEDIEISYDGWYSYIISRCNKNLKYKKVDDVMLLLLFSYMNDYMETHNYSYKYDNYFSKIALKLLDKARKIFPKYEYLPKIYAGLGKYDKMKKVCYNYLNKVKNNKIKPDIRFIKNLAIGMKNEEMKMYEISNEAFKVYLNLAKKPKFFEEENHKGFPSIGFAYFNIATNYYKLNKYLKAYNNFVLAMKNKKESEDSKKYDFKIFKKLKTLFLDGSENQLSEKPYFFTISYGKKLDEYKKLLEVSRVLRNTIFALHGYKFKNKDLQEYFESKSWYKPDDNFTPKSFNEIEKGNINYFKEFEKIVKSENNVKKLEEKLKLFEAKWKESDDEKN